MIPQVPLEELNIQQYIDSTQKDRLISLLTEAVSHALMLNFRLYMTYDKSNEIKWGCIPLNMWTNAIIDLTHKRKKYYCYPPKTKSPVENSKYYGVKAWKPILLILQTEMTHMINRTLEYNEKGEFEYTSNVRLIEALCRTAWTKCFIPSRL